MGVGFILRNVSCLGYWKLDNSRNAEVTCFCVMFRRQNPSELDPQLRKESVLTF
jgi:hypothetical protein